MHLGVVIPTAFGQTTVMDESGPIVERAKVPTDREHRSEFFRRHSGSRAVIESNPVWEFVYDELRSLGIDTILANPLQVRAIAKSKTKTDRVDSATLAHLLRANLIPEAWAGPKATRDLRKDVRARPGLRRLSPSLKHPVYAEYIRTGVPYAEGSLGSKKGRERAVECLGTDPRVSTRRERFGAIEEKIQEFHRKLRLPKFEENRKAQLLAPIPGVGFYTALTVVAFVGDADRFPDRSTLVSSLASRHPSTDRPASLASVRSPRPDRTSCVGRASRPGSGDRPALEPLPLTGLSTRKARGDDRRGREAPARDVLEAQGEPNVSAPREGTSRVH